MIAVFAALLSTASAAEGCDLSGPLDAPFRVPVQGERVRLILELWSSGADPAWGTAILDVLDARGLPAMVVVPAAPPDDASAALLARVRGTDHDVAVAIGRSLAPETSEAMRSLKRLVAPLRQRVGKIRTIVAPTGSRTREGMLGRAGFHSLIDVNPTSTASPRMAAHFDNQQRINVVLPSGPYEGPCGIDPRIGPLTPAAADRVGQALQRAARSPGTPVVRFALDGASGAPTDAEVLGRWLDTVVLPGHVRVVTAERARLDVLAAYRDPPVDEVIPEVGGRLVSVDEVRAAAGGLGPELEVLPRSLPGELNPTEAFFALAMVLADRTEGPVVRLGALHGPAQLANTTLPGPIELDPADVRAVAVALVSAMPSEIPGALSVGGRLLTASELLLAFASTARGNDPVTTRPVAVPDPNQRGLGWGDATLP